MKRFTLGMIAALLIAFFTFASAIVINRTVFERLPHLEDEFGYLYQAKIFAGGHAWVPRNEPVKTFWQPFVIQPETSPDGIQKRFGKYTPGWPLLLSIGVLLGTPWIINPILSTISVLLVYRLGREIFSEAVGLVSALLLAISPMALLLNATLMSHVPAMFMAVGFVYAYWRLTRHGKRRYAWAAVAGLALGLMISTRPLSAVAIAAPVILHAFSRVVDAAFSKQWRTKLLPTLRPLLLLSLLTIPTAALWPITNQIWTGDFRTNTYTLLWAYDKPGFGPDYGLMAGGHTLEYGWRNARADLDVYLRDLFGFNMSPTIEKYLADNLGWGAGIGLSWILVVAGLFAGRKSEWIWLFFELFIAIVIAQMTYWIGSVVHGGAAYSLRYWYEATFGMCLVGGYGTVALVKSLRGKGTQLIYAAIGAYALGWVLFNRGGGLPNWYIPLGVGLLILCGVLAAIGAEIKKATVSRAITISYLNGLERSGEVTVPVRAATLTQRLQQIWYFSPGYVLLIIVVGFSLIGYTPARFKESLPGWPDGLFRYNKVGQQQIDAINAMRTKYGKPGQPVLIVVLRSPNASIEDNWRDYGAAMAMTSPYLDSNVILARVFDKEDAPDVEKRFSERLVLYQVGENLYKSVDEALAGDKQVTSSGSTP
ncbi:MAG: glycosyltransferase family 39 protein [Chloroflexota bacterium]